MGVLSRLTPWGPPQLNETNFCQRELASAAGNGPHRRLSISAGSEAGPAVTINDGYEIVSAESAGDTEETARREEGHRGQQERPIAATAGASIGIRGGLTAEALRDSQRHGFPGNIEAWVHELPGVPQGEAESAYGATTTATQGKTSLPEAGGLGRPGPSSSNYFSDVSVGFAPVTGEDSMANDIMCIGCGFDEHAAPAHIHRGSLEHEFPLKKKPGQGLKGGKGSK